MNYLTKDFFLEKVNSLKLSNPEHWGNTNRVPGQPVATDRWAYHKKAVEILKKLKTKSILEAGSMNILLTDQSDTIDLDLPDWGWRLTYEPTYNYDLTQTPWEVLKNKQYDVFVALRVFHHMEDEVRYLKEMERVAHNIILALTKDSAERYEQIRKADQSYYFPETDTTLLFYGRIH